MVPPANLKHAPPKEHRVLGQVAHLNLHRHEVHLHHGLGEQSPIIDLVNRFEQQEGVSLIELDSQLSAQKYIPSSRVTYKYLSV
jgi:hypothetical protein